MELGNAKFNNFAVFFGLLAVTSVISTITYGVVQYRRIKSWEKFGSYLTTPEGVMAVAEVAFDKKATPQEVSNGYAPVQQPHPGSTASDIEEGNEPMEEILH